MTDHLGAAIQVLAQREKADGVRREIQERLAIERLVLECEFRFPWMHPDDVRRAVRDLVDRPPVA